MRAIVLTTGVVMLLATAGAHAKGGAVTSAEVCDAARCMPAEPAPALDGLMSAVWAAGVDGARHVDAARDTPHFRIRLTLEEPHATAFFDPGQAIGTVEIDYAPEIEAVRIVEPPTKGHWARIDDMALATLEGMADGAGLSPRQSTSHCVTVKSPSGTVAPIVHVLKLMASLGGAI